MALRALQVADLPWSTMHRRTAKTLLAALAVSLPACPVLACSGDGDGGDPAPTRESTTTTTQADRPNPDDLGEGTHQALVMEVDTTRDTVTLDGVQVLLGMEAVFAYLADTNGAQLEGPQVYVRNATTTPTELPVDTSGSFELIAQDTCCEPTEVGWDGFTAAVEADFEGIWGNNPPMEVTISDGEVTGLRQIYIP